MNRSYTTWVPGCPCKAVGVIKRRDGRIVCCWCRRPYVKGGQMLYAREPAQPAPHPMKTGKQRKGDPENPPCWCGTRNPYYAPLPRRCGGSGVVECLCGGDFCVCHWHGEDDDADD